MLSRLIYTAVVAALVAVAAPRSALAQAGLRVPQACQAPAPALRGTVTLQHCVPPRALADVAASQSVGGPAAARLFVTLPRVSTASSHPGAGDDPFMAQRLRRGRKAEGTTLMIIGGAAFVSGLVIGGTGGTVLAVGGIGVGAYGIYLFVN